MCTALWSLLSKCGSHVAQTFSFPRLLVRIQYILAGQILTSVATATHEILHIYSRTDFTHFTCSSVITVGAALQGMSCVSS
jgi:hypothetical protein